MAQLPCALLPFTPLDLRPPPLPQCLQVCNVDAAAMTPGTPEQEVHKQTNQRDDRGPPIIYNHTKKGHTGFCGGQQDGYLMYGHSTANKRGLGGADCGFEQTTEGC